MLKVKANYLMRFAWLFPAIIMLSALAMTINEARYGLGLLDESLILKMSSSSDSSLSYGGIWSFYTHVLYVIARGDIVTYRVMGIVLLFLLSLLYGYCLTRTLRFQNDISKEMQNALVCVFGMAGLFFYQKTLMSPGYDWLALIGALLALSGICLVNEVRTSISRFGAYLFGIGVFVATAARPFAGVFLGSAVVVNFLIQRRKAKLKFLFTHSAVAFSIMLTLHFVFVAGIQDTVRSYVIAMQISASDEQYSILALSKVLVWQFAKAGLDAISMSYGLVVILPLALYLLKRFQVHVNTDLFRIITLGFVGFIGIWCIFVHSMIQDGMRGGSLWVLLAATYFCTLFLMPVAEPEVQVNRWQRLSTLVLPAGAILACTFSSNIGPVYSASFLFIFYVAFCTVCARENVDSRLQVYLTVSLMIFVMTVSLTTQIQSLHYPTFSGPEKLSKTLVGPNDSTIYTDSATKQEIDNVRALKAKIPAGQVGLNLTPYAIFASFELETKHIETPYFIQGSEYIGTYIKRNRAKLINSWIYTTGKVGVRYDPVSPAPLISLLGREFPTDYEKVSSISGHFCVPESCTIDIWKPKILRGVDPK